MSAKQRKEYLERFESWVSNVEDTIVKWKVNLPDSLQDELDFTPNSLIALERYLLEMFPDSMEAYKPENASIIDPVTAYIGEFFIKNFPDSKWCFPVELKNESNQYPELCIKGLVNFIPFFDIPPVLKFRTGETLFDRYQKTVERLLVVKDQIVPSIQIETRGFAYQYMFLLTDPKYTLQQLQAWLETYYQKKIVAQKASLELHLPGHLLLHLGTYRFHFIHKDEDWVKEESAEMADNYRGTAVSKDQIRQCASRIEFYGDEDPQMDYFNEQFSLLHQLKDEPGLLIFDYLNNQFIQEV